MPEYDRQSYEDQRDISLASAKNAAAAIAAGGNGSKTSQPGMTSGLQAALKTAQDNFNSIMSGGGGGGSSAGGGLGYDPVTQMTAYQQATINQNAAQAAAQQQIDMLKLNQNQGQFNTSTSVNQGQFSQNYLLDYLKTMQSLDDAQGTPIDWAHLDIDQQKQDLANTLGGASFVDTMARLDLASQDMDLKRILGQGDYQFGQAQIAAQLQKMNIDSRSADLDYQVAMAKMGIDQQLAQARLAEVQAGASAAASQAQADMARAQAALQAVQVELELGNGNLALGQQKADQAYQLGLMDMNMREEELGSREKLAGIDADLKERLGFADIDLREKLGGQDIALRGNLGMLDAGTRMAIANQQAQVDLARINQEGGYQKAQLLAQLHGQPRDWLRYQTVLQGTQGDLPANFAAIANGGEIPTFQGPTGNIETWDLNKFNQDTGLGVGSQARLPQQIGSNDFMANFMQYMQGMGATPTGGGGLITDKYRQAGTTNTPGQFTNTPAAGGPETAQQQLERMRLANTAQQAQMSAGMDPGWTDAAARVTGTGGGEFDPSMWKEVTDAAGNKSMIRIQGPDASSLTEFGGLPVQETYKMASGYTYSVPAGYGPQFAGDVRVGGPAPKKQTEPLINADGSVTMPDGITTMASQNVYDPSTGQVASTTNPNMISGGVAIPAGVNPNDVNQMMQGYAQQSAQTAAGGGGQTNKAATFVAPGGSTTPGNTTGSFTQPQPTTGAAIPANPFGLFTNDPFANTGNGGGGGTSIQDAMALYAQLMANSKAGHTAPSQQPASAPSVYQQLQQQLLQQMLSGQTPTTASSATTSTQTPTMTAPGLPSAAATTPYTMSTDAAAQLAMSKSGTNPYTGRPYDLQAATGYTGGGAVNVPPDNYQQYKAMADLQYLVNKGPTDFINFPGQGGAQSISKSGNTQTGSWLQQPSQPSQTPLQQATQQAQQSYQQWGGQGVVPSPVDPNRNAQYQVPQWTNPNYSQPTQSTNVSFGDMNSYGDAGRAGADPGMATSYRPADYDPYDPFGHNQGY